MDNFWSEFWDTLISIIIFLAAIVVVGLTAAFCWKGMWWTIPIALVILAVLVTLFNRR